MTANMTANIEHRLEGLEPDNLLAFMALLGLLRALETSRPDWRPRAFWDLDRQPWRPVLRLAVAHDQDAIAQAVASGVSTLAAAHLFDRDDLNYSAADIRRIQIEDEDDSLRRALFAALCCDAAIKDDEDKAWPSPLCFLFGQGHQHFLSRLADIPKGVLPSKLRKLKSPPDLRAPEHFSHALFAVWKKADPTDGFRWDPAEDRRYALRADDPSGDPAGMQHGANVLAAVALPLFPGTAIIRRGETRFLCLGAQYNVETGQIEFSWPLWKAPARVHAIQATLATNRRWGDAPRMRATRISVGKFFNVTPGNLVKD